MQSKVTTVDEYIAEALPERQEALRKLRALCLEHLVGFDEAMAYGMPAYSRAGDEVGGAAFASQKNYISLYITREGAAAVGKPQLESRRGVSFAKGCFRFSKPEHIDYDVVEEMLKATVTMDGPGC
mgnify:CR=1 FL=1